MEFYKLKNVALTISLGLILFSFGCSGSESKGDSKTKTDIKVSPAPTEKTSTEKKRIPNFVDVPTLANILNDWLSTHPGGQYHTFVQPPVGLSRRPVPSRRAKAVVGLRRGCSTAKASRHVQPGTDGTGQRVVHAAATCLP